MSVVTDQVSAVRHRALLQCTRAALAVPVASPLKLAALAVPVPNPLKLAALAVQERLASSPSYKTRTQPKPQLRLRLRFGLVMSG